MASPTIIYQGADRDIVVTHDDTDLATATEIEVIIASTRQELPTSILKTLTGGGVSGVTSTEFTVTIEDADTLSATPGEYDIQCRATSAAGVRTQGIFNPNKVKITDSLFTDTT